MGLDYVSAVFWSVLGNFTPIPLLIFFYQQLSRIAWIGRWLRRIERQGVRNHWLDRFGFWFLAAMTPVVGAWTVAIVAPNIGMKPSRIMGSALLTITAYAILTALLVANGIQWMAR